jgi:glutaminyl-peptide cyclotransferase
MTSSGKKDAQGTGGGKAKKGAAKAAAPAVPPPESVETKANRLGSLALTVLLVLVGGLVVWKKWGPKDIERLTNVPPPEVEKEWKTSFDGGRALDIAKRLCDLGPRASGTDGIKAAREFIKAEMAVAGVPDVREHTFTEKTPVGDVEFKNLIGVLPGKRPEAIAFASHYDSKRFDNFRFVGANDAASAVGLTIELARQLKADLKGETPEMTYYFVFFDGEEAFNEQWGNQEDGSPDHTYGSRRLAGSRKDWPISCLILTDMIGEKDFSLVNDENSTPWMRRVFIETCRETFGVNFFRTETGMQDDHIPFKDAGVPVIDLIDFEFGLGRGLGQYGFWHTADDTPDKLDRRGFDITGTLVLKALPKVEKKLVRDLGPVGGKAAK